MTDYYPQLPFFAFSQTGTNLDPRGNPYTDLGTLTAGTMADVGQHTVTLVTYQDINDPTHGYSSPYRGIIPQHEQQFTLTI